MDTSGTYSHVHVHVEFWTSHFNVHVGSQLLQKIGRVLQLFSFGKSRDHENCGVSDTLHVHTIVDTIMYMSIHPMYISYLVTDRSYVDALSGYTIDWKQWNYIQKKVHMLYCELSTLQNILLQIISHQLNGFDCGVFVCQVSIHM